MDPAIYKSSHTGKTVFYGEHTSRTTDYCNS
jgi:hypothetical protein